MNFAKDRFWQHMYEAYDDGDTDKVAGFIEALGGINKAVDAWLEWKNSRHVWTNEPVNPHEPHGLRTLFSEVVLPPLPQSWRTKDASFYEPPGVLH